MRLAKEALFWVFMIVILVGPALWYYNAVSVPCQEKGGKLIKATCVSREVIIP